MTIETHGMEFVVDASGVAKGFRDYESAVQGIFKSLDQFERKVDATMKGVESAANNKAALSGFKKSLEGFSNINDRHASREQAVHALGRHGRVQGPVHDAGRQHPQVLHVAPRSAGPLGGVPLDQEHRLAQVVDGGLQGSITRSGQEPPRVRDGHQRSRASVPEAQGNRRGFGRRQRTGDDLDRDEEHQGSERGADHQPRQLRPRAPAPRPGQHRPRYPDADRPRRTRQLPCPVAGANPQSRILRQRASQLEAGRERVGASPAASTRSRPPLNAPMPASAASAPTSAGSTLPTAASTPAPSRLTSR
jgi:hypothetical protein